MKNKLIKWLSGLSLGIFLTLGVINSRNVISEVKAEDQTYSFGELPSKGWNAKGATVTLNDVDWTYTTSSYIGKNNSAIQVGSSNNPQKTDWTISTPISSFGENATVSKVELKAYVTADTGTYDISVGGSSKKSGSLSTTKGTSYSTDVLSVSEGSISVTVKGTSSSKAIYIGDIAVTFSSSGGITPVTYTINFNANGGEGEMSSATVKKGESYTVPACSFAAPYAKKFKVWSIDQAGTQEIQVGQNLTPTEDITLYAQWRDAPVIPETGSVYALVTDISQIHDGDQFIFVNKSGDDYYASTYFNGKGFESTEVEVNNGVIKLDELNDYPLDLEVSGDHYQFSGYDKTLDNYYTFGASKSNELSTSGSGCVKTWDISFDDDSTVRFENTHTSSGTHDYGYIMFNLGGGKVFKNYKGTMSPVYMYAKTGEMAEVKLDAPSWGLQGNVGEQLTLGISEIKGIDQPYTYSWSIYSGASHVALNGPTNTNSVTIDLLSESGEDDVYVQVDVNGTNAKCKIVVTDYKYNVLPEGEDEFFILNYTGKQALGPNCEALDDFDLSSTDNRWFFEKALKGDNSYYLKNEEGKYLQHYGSSSRIQVVSSTTQYWIVEKLDSNSHYTLINSYETNPRYLCSYDSNADEPSKGEKWEFRAFTDPREVSTGIYQSTLTLTPGAELESITFEGSLVKSTYNDGDTFDSKGLTFFLNYEGNVKLPLTSEIEWSIVDGTKDFVTGHVTVAGKVYTVTVGSPYVTITNFQPTGLEITPAKTEYFIGELVNPDDFEVVLKRSFGQENDTVNLTSNDFSVSPEQIQEDTEEIIITYNKNREISESVSVTVSKSHFVVANNIHTGDIVTIGTFSSDYSSYKGGHELYQTPSGSFGATAFTYLPLGNEKFLVNEVSNGVYTLKNTENNKYLRSNGSSFAYAEEKDDDILNGEFTYHGSYLGYDFSIDYELFDSEGGEYMFVMKDSGLHCPIEMYNVAQILGQGCEMYLFADGTGEIDYTIHDCSDYVNPFDIPVTVEITWVQNGGGIKIYYTGSASEEVTDDAKWSIHYEESVSGLYDGWQFAPFSNQNKLCYYNPDGANGGKFGFYETAQTKYEEVCLFRDNTVALESKPISISIDPEEIEVSKGEEIPWTSLIVKVRYENGVTKTIPVGGYDISLPNTSVPGKYTGTIYYGQEGAQISKEFPVIVHGKTQNFVFENGEDGITLSHPQTWKAKLYGATIPEDEPVTFSSDDENVCTIDQFGYVTTVGAGKTTIRATSFYGDIEATMEVTVKVPATDVSFEVESKEITIGETFNLTPIFEPLGSTGALTWASDNESVATINDGVVRGISSGTAHIKASLKNGKYALCTVTVKNIPVESIIIACETEEITVGDTLQLTATISPDNATNKGIVWSVDSSEIARINNSGLLTSLNEGTVTVKATSLDDNTIYAEKRIKIVAEEIEPVDDNPSETRRGCFGSLVYSSGLICASLVLSTSLLFNKRRKSKN